MKKRISFILPLLIFIPVLLQSQFQSEFITTWAVPSTDLEITIEADPSYSYKYTVDWGDGNQDRAVLGDISHTYLNRGSYEIKISGTFPKFHSPDVAYLTSIDEWGNIEWKSMREAFEGAILLQNISKFSPDLDSVQDMHQMFRNCKLMNSKIEQWDVSNVTDMTEMFQGADIFNQSLDDWDVSNVTTMRSMFWGADEFNGNITSWDVSSVTRMDKMFNNANDFNQEIGGWDVDTVTNMSGTFSNARSFNGDISNWDVSRVTRMDNMFDDAVDFNQDIGGWAVDSVTLISSMFVGAESFNQDLRMWNVSNITNMHNMFDDADAFNQNLGNWNISNVTNMSNMLDHTALSMANYDSTLIGWARQMNTPNGITLGAEGLEYCISDTDHIDLTDVNNYNWTIVDNGRSCPFMTTWKTDNSGTSSNSSITIPTILSGYSYDIDWDNDGVYDDMNVNGSISHDYGTSGTYEVAIKGSFPRIYFNNSGDKNKIISIDQWGDIEWSSMERAFYNCDSLVYKSNDTPNLTNTTSTRSAFQGAGKFNGNISKWDISTISNMTDMLDLTAISLSTYDSLLIAWSEINGLQNNVNFGVKGLNYCAGDAARQNLIDTYGWIFSDDALSCNPFITTWDTRNLGMTNNTSIEIPTSGNGYTYDIDWDNDGIYDDHNVTGTYSHDYDIEGIYTIRIRGNFPKIHFLNSGDKEKIISIDQWGDISWSDMTLAFYGCSNLEYSAIDFPDLTNVNSLQSMFLSATSFNGDISNWNMSTITDMTQMFWGASSFDQNLGNWDISNVSNMTSMFSNTPISKKNYDLTLIGWASQSQLQNDVSLGASDLTYCEGESAHQSLKDNYNWNITGDTKACQLPFITTWQTDNHGSSNSTSITIPTSGSGYSYNVDWNNDGLFDTIGVTGNITHDYGTPGSYQVAIRGDFPKIYMGGSSDNEKITSIDQWGGIEWQSMSSAFRGCSHLGYTAIDTPDLSNVRSMSSMFEGCTEFNGNIGTWDVSNIVSLQSTFREASSFNQDIGNWDVSHVTDMESTFSEAIMFNQDISDWKVDSVTTMYEMFATASAFNQDIGGWNTGMVEYIEEMFKEAAAFNQDISEWDLSRVQGIRSMFLDATSFNQDLSNWDMSHFDNLSNLFSGATSFNQDLGDWDISNVTDMTGMLDSTNLSQHNYDNTLKKWAQGQFPNPTIQSDVILGAAGLELCTGSDARKTLRFLSNWTIIGDLYNCSDCTNPIINEWQGPSEGNWYNIDAWSQGTVPDMCDLVIIPSGNTVTIDAPYVTLCHSIEVANGGSLINESPSELIMSLGIPEEEGPAARTSVTH